MTEREAIDLLDEAELVPAMQGPIADIKKLVGRCLDADIPAALERCRGKS